VASHTEVHADMEQRPHWADDGRHKDALLDHILADRDVDQALIFTSTQRDADWLADRLAEFGHRVASLHGGMPQGRRNRVLQGLRSRDLRVLVATDVAARGIDVPTISHVINYGLPMKAEDYVHRIGRTGRAGRAGLAVTLAERRDSGMVRRIEHFTTHRIPPTVIAGLEPQRPPMPEPRPQQRKDFRPNDRRGPPRHFGDSPAARPMGDRPHVADAPRWHAEGAPSRGPAADPRGIDVRGGPRRPQGPAGGFPQRGPRR
jgi:superfamily II DNA/RNA helicase